MHVWNLARRFEGNVHLSVSELQAYSASEFNLNPDRFLSTKTQTARVISD